MLPINRNPRKYTEEEFRILEAESERIDALNWTAQAICESAVKGFTFGDLKQVQFPERTTLLARGETPILRAGQLAQVFAERGVGKTWFTRTIAIVMASSGQALGFHAPASSRVLYLDGEMASEDIQKRDRLLANVVDVPDQWDSHNLVTVANDWQDEPMPRVDTEQGQAAIEPMIEWADIVIVDNRACLFDPEGEKEIEAWEPAQAWLLSLRRRGKAVIIVHHGNRQGGARGIGRAEDALDLVVKLARPEHYKQSEGARFILSYEKARGIPGGSALEPFEATLTPNGWVCATSESESGDAKARRRLLDVISQASRDGTPFETKTAAVKAAGGNKQVTMATFDALVREGLIEQGGDPAAYHPVNE
jgi:AAA domain-containing protein